MANLQIRLWAVLPVRYTFVKTQNHSISLFTFLTFLSLHFIPSTFCVARRVEGSGYFWGLFTHFSASSN